MALNPLNFDIVMPFSSADGYGASGEQLVLAATNLGAKIGVKSHDWREEKYTAKRLLDLEVSEYNQDGILVVYFIPYAFHHFRARFQIGMTMFETTEIPDTWARFCTIPNGLIVPSPFCKEVFQKKVDKQIEVASLGVNTKIYPYVEREKSSVFTFLMAGLLHYRKGAEFAVKAFKQEFSEDEPVRLVLKTRKNFLDIGDQSLDHSSIEAINWDYSRSDMLELYHAADCFIAPSRGEASGLTPREAMSTGLPCIVTEWGGLKEVADPTYTYPLQVEDFEVAPVVCSSYSEGITQRESIGNFARPSVKHLRELMREIYENKEAAKDKGRAASQWVQKEWSFEKCARTWLDSIERIYKDSY